VSYSKQYYQDNKEKIKAQALEYYYNNKEKCSLNNKKYYLNNKDILKEIHKSKTSFCYFTNPEYANYDLIITTPIEKITKTKVLEARRNRAARLTQLKAEELGLKKKEIAEQALHKFQNEFWQIPASEVLSIHSYHIETAKT